MAKEIFHRADAGEAIISIPTVCFAETVYLVEAGKFSAPSYVRLIETLLQHEEGSYRIIPFTMAVVKAFPRVPRTAIPELPDRMIAATALHLGLPLITKDEAIRGWDGITTLW